MKKLFIFILGPVLLVLASCTSNEGALKKQALAEAEKRFMESVQKDADDSIAQSEWLKKSYVEFMKKWTEYEVEDVKMQGENLGVVTVVIKSYAPTARKTLLKIAGTVTDSEARRFNFANALQLISQQTGAPSGVIKQPFATLSFKKDSGGEWRVIE